MISRDPNIFRKGSAAYLRHEEYRALVDDLRVIVTGRGYWKSDTRGASGFDLVTTQDPFEAGVLGWLLSLWYRAAFQVQVHTDIMSPKYGAESFLTRVRVFIARMVLGRASCVRVVSSRIARSLAEAGIVQESRISVLPILSEANRDSAGESLKERYPQFKHVLLMASRITREKNIELAIRAFKDVLRHYPEAGLVIVGEGPCLPRLKSFVEKNGLSKNVVFEGWKDSLGSYYASADLFLLSSDYEGYGLSLIEAARLGCPIVTTHVGLIGDLLGPSEAGIVPPGDRDAFAKEIIETLGNSELRESRKMRAQSAAQNLPSKETYLNTYRELWTTCGKK